MIVKIKKILIDSKLECASGEALESFELMTDFYGELNEKKIMQFLYVTHSPEVIMLQEKGIATLVGGMSSLVQIKQ